MRSALTERVKDVEAEKLNVHKPLVQKPSGQLRNLGSLIKERGAIRWHPVSHAVASPNRLPGCRSAFDLRAAAAVHAQTAPGEGPVPEAAAQISVQNSHF